VETQYFSSLEDENKTTMTSYKDMLSQLIKFRDDRDWKQFHDSKNLATAISIEAAELNELFLWKTIKESEEVDIAKIKEELADILSFAFLLAEKHGLDPFEIVADKIKINGNKYPVEKAKGKSDKYDKL
jgi:NTP pyrophosphatase (non-canonical NTP hydrolase)